MLTRVADTAQRLLDGVAEAWGLTGKSYRQALQWAAQLHEIGLDIAHSKYHQHGAYLLENADLPGFGRQEQLLLAALVGGHRRKLSNLNFAGLTDSLAESAAKLLVLLRLAVLLHRSRAETELPELVLLPGPRALQIRFPEVWLASNQLTQADLAQETGFLDAVGFQLRTSTI